MIIFAYLCIANKIIKNFKNRKTMKKEEFEKEIAELVGYNNSVELNEPLFVGENAEELQESYEKATLDERLDIIWPNTAVASVNVYPDEILLIEAGPAEVAWIGLSDTDKKRLCEAVKKQIAIDAHAK